MGTKARVLVDTKVQGVDYKPNQLVEFPDDVAKSLAKEGIVDTNKAAIAYCVDELKSEVVVHQKPESAAAEQTAETQQQGQ